MGSAVIISSPDLVEAERFLAALGEPPWTFQVFNDRKPTFGRPWHRPGTFLEHASALTKKNADGYGVYACVNRCNGNGRKKADVDLVRAMFLDLDGTPLDTVLHGPFKPHIVVETSPRHWHVYWRIVGCALTQFDDLLDAMVQRFGTCKGAKGINRVLRLPGFYHLKGEPHLVRIEQIGTHPPFTYDEFTAEFLTATAAIPPKAKNEGPSGLSSTPAKGFQGTDDDLLAAARRSANGSKFSTLFDLGDISTYDGDDSAADCALCALLVFWCGSDVQRIDRLFRRSALFRDKWDEKRATSTYGNFTIAKALSKVRTYYSRPLPVPGVGDDSESGHETLQDLGRSIDAQLNEPQMGRARSTRRAIAKLVAKWMNKRGRLLADSSTSKIAPYIVAENNEVLPVEDSLSLRTLLSLTSLNATETMYKWLVADLAVSAVRDGKDVLLRRYSHWTESAVYVSSGPSHIVRATPTELRLIPNGTDDVWFPRDRTFPKWEPAPPLPPRKVALLQPTLIAPPEVPEYTEEIQIALLHAWMIAAITGIRPMPVLLLLGHMGCGKSSTARGIAVTARGSDANVQTLPPDKRDAEIILATSPLVCLDNLDSEQEDWFVDLIAAAVTGASVEHRKLYTTSETVTLPITASLCISSRTPLFAARADIQERVLPIFFGQRDDDKRVDDRALLDEIGHQRDGILSWSVQQATVLLRARSEPAVGRFQRFGRLVEELNPARGRLSLELAYKAARVAVADLHPLIAALLQYNKPIRGTTRDIIDTLTDAGFAFEHAGGGKRIANLLREHKSLIDFREDPPTRKGVQFHVFASRGVVNAVNVANFPKPFCTREG